MDRAFRCQEKLRVLLHANDAVVLFDANADCRECRMS